MLVQLLKLPPLEPVLAELARAKIVVRRAQPFELTPVRAFIEREFGLAWADEVSVGFANKPITVFVATLEKEIIGVAGYECTRRGFFGPAGVLETMRDRGVGKALLLGCLWGLRELGYVYGIIGSVGPVEFYEKTVGAVIIPDSDPGIYVDPLK
ncbi:MAG: GNAT family N-acetyltransferase [Acidobacteriota bacterium]